MGFIGPLLGAAASLFGGSGDSNSGKIGELYGKAKSGVDRAYLRHALPNLYRARKDLAKGYRGGMLNLQRTEDAQRQELLGLAQQNQADVTQQNLQSGLARTTAYPTAMRGAAYDIDRAMAQLNANLAAQRSSMFINRGMAMAQNRNQIAALWPQWAGAMNNIRMQQAQQLGQVPDEPSGLQKIGGILGKLPF